MYPDASPYRRIMRLYTEEGGGGWQAADIDPVSHRLVEHVYTVPQYFAGRVLRFARQYLSGGSEWYNCHLFAALLRGCEPLGSVEVLRHRPYRTVIEGIVADSYLPLGQNGIVGVRASENSDVFHGLVGLGENIDACIQVDRMYGMLCIGSYADILDHFSRTYAAGSALYVLPA